MTIYEQWKYLIKKIRAKVSPIQDKKIYTSNIDSNCP